MHPQQQACTLPPYYINNTFPVAKAVMQTESWDCQTVRPLCSAGVVHHMERTLAVAFTATQLLMSQ